jgi:hypothetical protein
MKVHFINSIPFDNPTELPPYMNGTIPMGAQFIWVGAHETIQDIFLRKCRGEADANDYKWLKWFMLYWLAAPGFDNPLTQGLRDKNLEAMNYDELLTEMIYVGIDPF